MLEAAFFETPDYKTLLENNSLQLVVGRRGTGKSPDRYSQAKHWNSINNLRRILISCAQTDFLGICDVLNPSQVRPQLSPAAAKHIWTYSLLRQATSPLAGH
jgi:hypothetical protein